MQGEGLTAVRIAVSNLIDKRTLELYSYTDISPVSLTIIASTSTAEEIQLEVVLFRTEVAGPRKFEAIYFHYLTVIWGTR
jgi:hypothetical protein